MVIGVTEIAQRFRVAFERVIVGNEEIGFGLQCALLARGNLLVEGVPGTGKTLAVRAFAVLLGMEFRRIQFTPDLMPSDITGTTVFNPKTADFSTRRGPIFANVVLADEINRTPPKTQAALLEAMEEGRVTIDGVPLPLPEPFFVCATQNPIEYEGTYPLPEAQLDRFLLKVSSSYPSREEELDLLERTAAGFDARSLENSGIRPIADAEWILEAQRNVRAVTCSLPVRSYVLDLVGATRSSKRLVLGASPRAAQAMLVCAQAAATLEGRDYVLPDDVKRVAPFVLAHRLIVHPHAEIDGLTGRGVVSELLATTAVPREATS
ncbi:MAG: MoxR family ATPase [Candidatus Eremiobacteraeota bacterium]|nr:MoxR family ATPase [Candidatus Eremiobacteraeota bacterium]